MRNQINRFVIVKEHVPSPCTESTTTGIALPFLNIKEYMRNIYMGLTLKGYFLYENETKMIEEIYLNYMLQQFTDADNTYSDDQSYD